MAVYIFIVDLLILLYLLESMTVKMKFLTLITLSEWSKTYSYIISPSIMSKIYCTTSSGPLITDYSLSFKDSWSSSMTVCKSYSSSLLCFFFFFCLWFLICSLSSSLSISSSSLEGEIYLGGSIGSPYFLCRNNL